MQILKVPTMAKEHAPPLEILYEDDFLVAVNKPANLPAHAGRRVHHDDLQSAAQRQLKRGLVLFHRLDADTTGVVLLGKNRTINPEMAAMFAEKRIRKTYWAVVAGRWQPQWNRVETRIDYGPGKRYRNVIIGGREAVSTIHLRAATEEKSWVEVLPKTGRTHQVRLHCLAMGCPILGDKLYGEAADVPMALHARRLDFRHPHTGNETTIIAELPSYWTERWLPGLEQAEAAIA